MNKIIITLLILFISSIILYIINSIAISSSYNSFLIQLRLNKLIAFFLIGGLLTLSGYIFQRLLFNPLAEPYMLGISSGSFLGITIFFMLFPQMIYSPFQTTIISLVSGLTGLVIILFLSNIIYNNITLILLGVAINFLFYGLNRFLITFLEPKALFYINSFSLGDFNNISLNNNLFLIFLSIISLIIFYKTKEKFFLLKNGEVFCKTAGINYKYYLIFFLSFASILASFTISFVGLIPFVGLAFPNIYRKSISPLTNKLSSPQKISFEPFFVYIFGGILLTTIGAFTTLLSYYYPIPIGVFTIILGSIIMISIIKKEANPHELF